MADERVYLRSLSMVQFDVELRRKYQVVKIKCCYERAKTVLFDFTAPLREWLPLVRKKFDRDDDSDLQLYLSGETQRTNDDRQPLLPRSLLTRWIGSS